MWAFYMSFLFLWLALTNYYDLYVFVCLKLLRLFVFFFVPLYFGLQMPELFVFLSYNVVDKYHLTPLN